MRNLKQLYLGVVGMFWILKFVKKCLRSFMKFAVPFQLFIVRIPFKYYQKAIKKKILNSKRKCQDS